MEPHPVQMISCFTCDYAGNVVKIVRDEFNVFDGKTLPHTFMGLFGPEQSVQAQQFWRTLMLESAVLSFPIRIPSVSHTDNANFDGIAGAQEITIFISYEHDVAESCLASSENTLLNKELFDLQRKTLAQILLIESLSRTLEKNDQEFQLLSRAINDAIWDWNIADNTIQWNQRLSSIYGYTQAQFPKTFEEWASNIHPEDREEATTTLRGTISTGSENWRSLYRYKTANGTYKYTFDRGVIVYVGTDAVRMIGVMQDIDERMASLQEVEKLSLVASKTDNLVIITDDQERIEWVNPGFVKRTGYTLNDVIGKTPRLMQGPETNRVALDKIRNQLNAKQSVTEELLNYTKEGKAFWLRVNINPVFNDENKLVKFVAVETDITANKEYEDKITAVANDLTNLIATINAPVFGIDSHGYINVWNNLASRLTGYNKNEVLEKDFFDTIVDRDSRTRILESLNSVFNGVPLSNIELPIISRNGEKFIILINVTPRRNAKDEVTSIFLVGQDITELTRYRESLEEEMKKRTEDLEAALKKEKELALLKTRFASLVSHEFRTPLATIRLSANQVKRFKSRMSAESVDEKLELVLNQVDHMAYLLEDVLSLGKTEDPKIQIRRTSIHVLSFFDSITSQLQSINGTSGHEIVFDFKFENDEWVTDQDLVRNIFTNLLTNAIKFSPRHKTIWFSGRETPWSVEFTIRDKGIGIAPADLDKIFQPFDRGGNVEGIPGTGLGLSIVKKATELLSGKISVSSKIGEGSTFTITFPKPR